MTDAIEIRHNIHPEMARAMDSEALRRHFRIEALFVPGAVRMTYSHIDRLVVAGIVPLEGPLPLPNPKAIGQARFFDAREGGVINIGGPGRVVVDGQTYPLAGDAALYISRGAGEVGFASDDAADPARFYIVSAPAHKELQTQIVDAACANRLELGRRRPRAGARSSRMRWITARRTGTR